MAYYHTVRIAQKTKSGVRTVTIAKNVSAFSEPGKASDIIRRAAAMPATIRIEVDETDTQLYGYPMAERTYPRLVIHPKDGRVFRYFGKGDGAAHLDANLDARRHLHTLRIS